MKRLFIISVLIIAAFPFTPAQSRRVAQLNAAAGSEKRVRSLRVVVLSTMLADAGIGEWGFAALVEGDGHRILFDTGAYPDTVRGNARKLGIDLADIQDVILSHFHGDHTGGLLTLRREFVTKNRSALSRVHVGKGFFWSRPGKTGEINLMIAEKPVYESTGGSFIEHSEPIELFPGVWLSGSVPSIHPERNWGGLREIQTPSGLVDDYLPEDMSLIIDTNHGLVVISGCGHAGVINTLEFARMRIRRAPIYAAIGGFHLYQLDDAKLDWTAARLREFGLKHFLGAHCTGIEAVYPLRHQVGLARKTSVVSSVGSSFTLGKGIDPLDLAR